MSDEDDFWDEPDEDPDADKGPWVLATFDSECACGLHLITGGVDMIRADGDGGWELEYCNV